MKRHLRTLVPPLLVLLLLVSCATPAPPSPAPSAAPIDEGARTPSPAPQDGVPPQPTRAGEEGFAIYLTAGALSVAQMAAADLAQVPLAETPLIATDDMCAYLKARHEIELTPEAYDRVRELAIPVGGRPFVVCVDRHPVYWGAFWTPLSSASFSGVVIMQPLGAVGHTIGIELGYPSVQDFQGKDPRGAVEIMDALAREGKLG